MTRNPDSVHDDDAVDPLPGIETDEAYGDEHDDPRARPTRDSAMPGETIDSEHNMPGQQGPPPPPDAPE